MKNRIKWITGKEPEDGEGEKEGEEEGEKKDEPKRTRPRARDRTPEHRPTFRCLQWENTMALDELGHLHSEPPPPPRSRKQTKKREAMAEPATRPATKTRRK